MALPAAAAALGRAASGAARVAGTGRGSSIGKLANAAGSAANVMYAAQALEPLKTGLVQMLGRFAATLPAKPIELFTKAMNAIQAPTLMVVDALKGFRNGVTALGNSISEFVQLASPVEVQKFKLASDDLTASIGKALIPVMRFATAFTRGFADVLFRLSGPLQNLMSAFFDPVAEAIPQLVNAIEPLINAFGEAINIFASLAKVIVNAFSPTKALVRLLGWFGLSGAGGGLSGTSTGAAVRPATIGSVEDYGRKAQQAAFSLGGAADPARESVNVLNNIYQWLTNLPTLINDLPRKLAEAIYQHAGERGGEKAKEITVGLNRGEDIVRRAFLSALTGGINF